MITGEGPSSAEAVVMLRTVCSVVNLQEWVCYEFGDGTTSG